MLKHFRWNRKRVWIPLALLAIVYVNNSSLLTEAPSGQPRLLAHRGVHQTFPFEGLQNDTCTAERIHPPEHSYLENTIPSMKAAFEAGADLVELDVQPTTDGTFAVFHDWVLECRTNGKGVTREHSMAELKKLDIGYGYTADGGKTFPFRGKGIGMMPSLDEVFREFPDQPLLIHVKSEDPAEGKMLAEFLSKLPESRLENLAVYGGDQPIEALKREMPELRVMSKQTMKECLIPYIAIGWTGYVPDSCAHTQLHLPEKIAPWLWGWPNRFLQRMEERDTRVILVAGGGGFSEGFDRVEDLERIPAEFSGWIWTNRIDRIGPELKQ
nr:glycerophosphodiester phosphodiesterase family protein [Staphylospora marina]